MRSNPPSSILHRGKSLPECGISMHESFRRVYLLIKSSILLVNERLSMDKRTFLNRFLHFDCCMSTPGMCLGEVSKFGRI